MSEPLYTELLQAWQVEFSAVDAEAQIEGSPERTLARVAVCDTAGGRWVLEQVDSNNVSRKQEVAEQLSALSALEQIHPYCRTSDGSFFQPLERKTGEGSAFMMRPFVEGVPLDRKTYLNDSWRIDAMADFLLQLRGQTAGWSGPSFSMCDYARHRMDVWRGRYSKLTDKMEASFQTLEKTFFPIHDQLPVAFCHGDYHPLNMVWGRESIRSVIDWEFCGIKPELYDVALLLGCIGFEDPDNLIREPAVRLIHWLRGAGFGEEISWENLLGLMAVIRYGWMSEWIRRSDREARQMEAVYINILVDQQDYISNHWKKPV